MASHPDSILHWETNHWITAEILKLSVGAAKMAYKYERHYYNPIQENWPDFRRPSDLDIHSSFGTVWCHGAPGIAISRLAAYDTTGDIS